MSLFQYGSIGLQAIQKREVTKETDPDALVVDGWSEGMLVGSLVMLSCITVANMRPGVWLHRLILIELVSALLVGFEIFTKPPAYGWYTAVTSTVLYATYTLHNVIAWMKIKPFLTPTISKIYIGTVILVIPYWILEAYANFAYNLNVNLLFNKTRPLEAIFREPWWVFTTISLFWNIKNRYGFKFIEILQVSPRFCVLLLAMCLSLCFVLADILSVVRVIPSDLPTGINPFWRISFVFKCLTDSVILDDFKTACDRLRQKTLARLGGAELGTLNTPQMHIQELQGRNLSTVYSSPKAGWDHIDFATTHELAASPSSSSQPQSRWNSKKQDPD